MNKKNRWTEIRLFLLIWVVLFKRSKWEGREPPSERQSKCFLILRRPIRKVTFRRPFCRRQQKCWKLSESWKIAINVFLGAGKQVLIRKSQDKIFEFSGIKLIWERIKVFYFWLHYYLLMSSSPSGWVKNWKSAFEFRIFSTARNFSSIMVEKWN